MDDQGFRIGRATGQGCNSLIDSLLQLLVALDIIHGPSSDANEALWRHEACELVRSHLSNHSNALLHPRVRSQAGEVLNLSSDMHARGFLEHQRHASEIVSKLITTFGLQNQNYVRPFRIRVLSRFDEVFRNSNNEGILVTFPGVEDIPPQ